MGGNVHQTDEELPVVLETQVEEKSEKETE